MKSFIKPLTNGNTTLVGLAATILSIAAVAFFVWIFGLWGSYILETIWAISVNEWLVGLVITVAGALTPEALTGWPLLGMFLCQCYIWFVM